MQAKTSQDFTSRLEALKLRLGLTDEELAARVGLSRRMLYLIRTGKSSITKKTWYKLEQAEKIDSRGIMFAEKPLKPPLVKDFNGECRIHTELDTLKSQIRRMRERMENDIDDLMKRVDDVVERIK